MPATCCKNLAANRAGGSQMQEGLLSQEGFSRAVVQSSMPAHAYDAFWNSQDTRFTFVKFAA